MVKHCCSLLGILLVVTCGSLHAQESCQDLCQQVFVSDGANAVDVCSAGCDLQPDFDPEYPYWLEAPLVPDPVNALVSTDIAFYQGTVWARVDRTRTKIQFRYQMNTPCDQAAPWCPHFAMHLHLGKILGSPIVVSIAGAGDIIACVAPPPPNYRFTDQAFAICHPDCTEGNQADGNCVAVENIDQCLLCNVPIARSYHCPGGCAGDGRIVGNLLPNGSRETLAPSRGCEEVSNAPQDEWIQGKYSNEYSGNPQDPNYSPHSIGVLGNFDEWCSESVPWLIDEVFPPGKASYVALHTNFNATGAGDLAFGE